jgi:hypothetical protein
MHRIATLATQRRNKTKLQSNGKTKENEPLWTDEELYDIVLAADGVEKQLAEEKTRMEALVRSKFHS